MVSAESPDQSWVSSVQPARASPRAPATSEVQAAHAPQGGRQRRGRSASGASRLSAASVSFSILLARRRGVAHVLEAVQLHLVAFGDRAGHEVGPAPGAAGHHEEGGQHTGCAELVENTRRPARSDRRRRSAGHRSSVPRPGVGKRGSPLWRTALLHRGRPGRSGSMKAVTWHGKRDVRVDTVPDPKIEEPTDAIVRITSTCICGSDLHLYEVLGAFIDEGDILGHEPMGAWRRWAARSATSRRGSRGRAVQHLLRILLDVRPAALLTVRDHPGSRLGQGPRSSATPRCTARSRRPGGVPARAAGSLRPDQGARWPAGRTLCLPVRRVAHRVAGRGLCRPPGGRLAAVFGLGPIGQMCSGSRCSEAWRR